MFRSAERVLSKALSPTPVIYTVHIQYRTVGRKSPQLIKPHGIPIKKLRQSVTIWGPTYQNYWGFEPGSLSFVIYLFIYYFVTWGGGRNIES